MCGITGIISPQKEKLIYKITRVLTHRGPDDEGYYHDDVISLGQRRLSIVDLHSGKQPISNEDNNLQLVCNGEIYNSPELRKKLIQQGHKFRTATDVEVILHLYEEYEKDCVKYLRGMFAFAIWDKLKKKLFIARDHLGQKPLFFYNNGSQFVFASEVKAILASELVNKEIDKDGLWHYVSLRFMPEQYSLFKNIKKLQSGSWLSFENNKVAIKKYWNLDFTDKLPNDEKQIEEGLNSLLLETTKQHLLSDVPVGTFLSGGIDSSTITAMVAEITGEKFPTFSIGVKEQKFNELPYADMVSTKYNLDAHNKIVQADLISLIPSMIYHLDEPSDPFGVGVYLVSQEASKYVKVVLGGDGGDENFAGYDRFAGNKLVDYYTLIPKWLRKNIIAKTTSLIPESFGYKSLAQKVAWVNYMSLYSGGDRYAQSMSFLRFTQDAKEKLFTDNAQKEVSNYNSSQQILKFFDANNANDLVDKMLFTDLMTRIPDHLLMIVDRMSMAHSLESRSPLLDYKLVEYAASIPADLKLKGKDLKYILKKVASRYLPKELIYRQKQGFGFPLALWMRDELKIFLTQLFKNPRLVEIGLFNHNYIQAVLNEHLQGKRDHNFRIWILINLELWYRMYFEGQSIENTNEYVKSLLF